MEKLKGGSTKEACVIVTTSSANEFFLAGSSANDCKYGPAKILLFDNKINIKRGREYNEN